MSSQQLPRDLPRHAGTAVFRPTYTYESVHVLSAREIMPTPKPLRVAIIAGRPRPEHPALAGVDLTYAAVPTPGKAPLDEPDDYTTALAAVIAGNDSQDFGGIAPGVKLLVLGAFAADGTASNYSLVGAIDKAVLGGAQVICTPWGGSARDKVMQVAIEEALEAGVAVVCPAGNGSNDEPSFPAAHQGCIAVGASDMRGDPAPFTNHGSWVTVSAPGVDLPVPQGPNDYTFASGTSWSCAIATAIVAMLLQARNELTPAEIKRILLATARPIGPPERHFGGLIDAYAAIRALLVGATKPASRRLSGLNWNSAADPS